MADSDQKHPKDMSIDELSAAIDAHVADVGKKPASKPKATAEKPTPKPNPSNEEPASKISVNRSSYISKAEEPKPPEPEPAPKKPGEDAMLGKKKVLQPISDQKPAETAKSEPVPAEKTATASNRIDMMFKQQEAAKPKPASASTPVKNEGIPPKPIEQKPEEKPKAATEPEEPAAEAKLEAESEASKTEAETEAAKEEKPPAKPEKSDNYIDKLARQIETKEDREKQAKEQEAKKAANAKNEAFLFDSKQYHIPIKAKNHRRRGNAVNIFLAMLAAALATLYVLNELDIINLVDMFLEE